MVNTQLVKVLTYRQCQSSSAQDGPWTTYETVLYRLWLLETSLTSFHLFIFAI